MRRNTISWHLRGKMGRKRWGWHGRPVREGHGRDGHGTRRAVREPPLRRTRKLATSRCAESTTALPSPTFGPIRSDHQRPPIGAQIGPSVLNREGKKLARVFHIARKTTGRKFEREIRHNAPALTQFGRVRPEAGRQQAAQYNGRRFQGGIAQWTKVSGIESQDFRLVMDDC
jgi:hypothetical protein